jgi:hypothetical protein
MLTSANTLGISIELKQAVKNFDQEPYFNNAISLKEKLDDEIWAHSNEGYEGVLKKHFIQTRERLLDDLEKTTEIYGDSDLTSQLSEARKYHIENVTPYENSPLFHNLRKGIMPDDYIEQLSQPINEKILRDIIKDPEQLSLLSAKIFSPSVVYDGDIKNVSAKKMLEIYANLPDNIKKAIDPIVGDNMKKLSKMYATHKKTMKLVKHITIGLIFLGILGTMIYFFL